jgi:hypothetical protein
MHPARAAWKCISEIQPPNGSGESIASRTREANKAELFGIYRRRDASTWSRLIPAGDPSRGIEHIELGKAGLRGIWVAAPAATAKEKQNKLMHSRNSCE